VIIAVGIPAVSVGVSQITNSFVTQTQLAGPAKHVLTIAVPKMANGIPDTPVMMRFATTRAVLKPFISVKNSYCAPDANTGPLVEGPTMNKRCQTGPLLATGMEYAANFIDGDARRGVFVKALVEGEEWAERDLLKHIETAETLAAAMKQQLSVSREGKSDG